MSGILNSKSRVLDVFITEEGKRQLSSGDLRIEHVSFSDDSTFYSADLLSGTATTENRVFLECCSLPQDSITFEADDSGKLKTFKNISNVSNINGQIFINSQNQDFDYDMIGVINTPDFVTGDTFSSLSVDLLSSSVANFKSLRLLSTVDVSYYDDKFKISSQNVNFTISDSLQTFKDNKVVSIEELDGLLTDVKTKDRLNFLFLPPIKKRKSDFEFKTYLGDYKRWSETKSLSFSELLNKLQNFDKKTVKFSQTSRLNNVLVQIFEITDNAMRKLDVLDFGKQYVQSLDKIVHIYFVGKVLTDTDQNDTFVNMFTCVFY